MIPSKANAGFVAAMEQVPDVYRRPYDPDHPVVCMDETPRQLIAETREPVAASAGNCARSTTSTGVWGRVTCSWQQSHWPERE